MSAKEHELGDPFAEETAQFMELTGSDNATATNLITACNGDIATAFELYCECQVESNPSIQETASSYSGNKEQGAATSEETNDLSYYPNEKCMVPNISNDGSEDVRSPDATQLSQLIRRSIDPTSRADDPSVTWMFPPPSHLSFPGTFADAKQEAKTSSKWILVNIQDHREFSSHEMNRDIWTHETLVSLIRMNFIFWQRGHTSADAQMFLSMYKLSHYADTHVLPIIAVVDSRTGELVLEVKGMMNVSDFTVELIQFLEDNDINSMRKVKNKVINVGKLQDAADYSKIAGANESEEEEDYQEYQYDYDNSDYMNMNHSVSTLKVNDSIHCDDDGVCTVTTSTKEVEQKPQKQQQQESAETVSEDISTRSVDCVSIAVGKEEVMCEHETYFTIEYESVPDEPPPGDDVVKVAIKLCPPFISTISASTPTSTSTTSSNKSVVRRFNKSDTIRTLYTTVAAIYADVNVDIKAQGKMKNFDMYSVRPRVNLGEQLDRTIGDSGIGGSKVEMQWR